MAKGATAQDTVFNQQGKLARVEPKDPFHLPRRHQRRVVRVKDGPSKAVAHDVGPGQTICVTCFGGGSISLRCSWSM